MSFHFLIHFHPDFIRMCFQCIFCILFAFSHLFFAFLCLFCVSADGTWTFGIMSLNMHCFCFYALCRCLSCVSSNWYPCLSALCPVDMSMCFYLVICLSMPACFTFACHSKSGNSTSLFIAYGRLYGLSWCHLMFCWRFLPQQTSTLFTFCYFTSCRVVRWESSLQGVLMMMALAPLCCNSIHRSFLTINPKLSPITISILTSLGPSGAKKPYHEFNILLFRIFIARERDYMEFAG